MKTDKLRIIIPLAILLVAGIGFAAHTGFGTLSAIGWEDIALLCPVGALTTMLASKMVVPRAVISIVLAIAAIVILGRAFCAWVCPVPVWSKLRTLFKRQPSAPDSDEDADAGEDATDAGAAIVGGAGGAGEIADGGEIELTSSEKAVLKTPCSACGHSCADGMKGSVCAEDAPSASRHIVLGGTLLSAAIFGFPVFCLICPIGLSFAFVFVLIMLFGHGDVTWSVIAIPVVLLLEVVFFRKWCSHICPLSALMSLVGKLNRTFRPSIDDSKCLETSRDAECGRCAKACEVGIDPRHPELGTSWEECTKCRACVEACPASAISMPFLAKKAVPCVPEVASSEPAKVASSGPKETSEK